MLSCGLDSGYKGRDCTAQPFRGYAVVKGKGKGKEKCKYIPKRRLVRPILVLKPDFRA